MTKRSTEGSKRLLFLSGIALKHFLVVNITFLCLVAGILTFIQWEAERYASERVDEALTRVEGLIEASMESRFQAIQELGEAIVKDSRIFPLVEAGRSADLTDICDELQKRHGIDRIIFVSAEGEILAHLTNPDAQGRNMLGRSSLVNESLQGRRAQGIMRSKGELLKIVALPIFDNVSQSQVIGAVLMARHHSADLEKEVRSLTGWDGEHWL